MENAAKASALCRPSTSAKNQYSLTSNNRNRRHRPVCISTPEFVGDSVIPPPDGVNRRRDKGKRAVCLRVMARSHPDRLGKAPSTNCLSNLRPGLKMRPDTWHQNCPACRGTIGAEPINERRAGASTNRNLLCSQPRRMQMHHQTRPLYIKPVLHVPSRFYTAYKHQQRHAVLCCRICNGCIIGCRSIAHKVQANCAAGEALPGGLHSSNVIPNRSDQQLSLKFRLHPT